MDAHQTNPRLTQSLQQACTFVGQQTGVHYTGTAESRNFILNRLARAPTGAIECNERPP